MSAPMPLEAPVTTATFPASFCVFIFWFPSWLVLSCWLSEKIWAGGFHTEADLLANGAEHAPGHGGRLRHRREATRGHRLVARLGALGVPFFDVRSDQVGKDQVRELRKLPRLGFLLIQDEVNDFAERGIGLLVVLLQLALRLGEGGLDGLEENGGGGWVSYHWLVQLRLYLTGRL